MNQDRWELSGIIFASICRKWPQGFPEAKSRTGSAPGRMVRNGQAVRLTSVIQLFLSVLTLFEVDVSVTETAEAIVQDMFFLTRC